MLVGVGQREQAVERARVRVDVPRRVADRRPAAPARCRCGSRPARSRGPRPTPARSRRARRRPGARSRARRPCGPWRSGCSRRRPTPRGRSSFHHFAVARPSPRRSTSRASATRRATDGDEVPLARDAGAPGCACRASRRCPGSRAARSPRARRATSIETRRTVSQVAPGVGSMSTRSSSGWSRSARRTGCGLKSTLPSETAQTRCAASTGTNSSAVLPGGEREHRRLQPRRAAWPARASGRRASPRSRPRSASAPSGARAGGSEPRPRSRRRSARAAPWSPRRRGSRPCPGWRA